MKVQSMFLFERSGRPDLLEVFDQSRVKEIDRFLLGGRTNTQSTFIARPAIGDCNSI